MLKWSKILVHAATRIENIYRIKLLVDEAILLEIGRMVQDSLDSMGCVTPNVAKVAGQISYWICKLKPLSIAPDSPNHFLEANERAALMVGLAIANLFEDDKDKSKKIFLPPDLLREWVISSRYHIHSQHSMIIDFELLLKQTAYDPISS